MENMDFLPSSAPNLIFKRKTMPNLFQAEITT